MLDLTPQERKTILFLTTVALIGIGTNFTLKVNSRVEKFIALDTRQIKMDINRATLEDLLRTRALPEKLAIKLLDYRNEHGAFSRLEQIKEIKGIGEYRYKKLEEFFFAG